MPTHASSESYLTHRSLAGTPLVERKAASGAELRAFVFEGGAVLPWLRIRDFQVVTLVAVAEELACSFSSRESKLKLQQLETVISENDRLA